MSASWKELGRHVCGSALILGFGLACGGCFFEASGEPPPPAPAPLAGRLTLRWTVDESTDPNLCAMGQATTIDIVITTTNGGFAGEFQDSCAAFATTVSTLAPGSYVATARLLAGDQARTTPIDINPFTIIENSELVVDVDFPADSFH